MDMSRNREGGQLMRSPIFDNDPDFDPYAGLPEPSTFVRVLVFGCTALFTVLVVLALVAAFLRVTGA